MHIRILFVLLLLGPPAFGQWEEYSEKEISNYIQTLIGGQREVTVPSGRIDLLHDSTAYEIEWANNWKEAVGQCLWYAQQTNTNPGIILIVQDKKKYKYYLQLNSTLRYANLDHRIKVFIFPRDFEPFMTD